MLAVRLYEKQDIRLEEAAVPTIGDGELLLKTEAAFLCGTDVRMIKHGHKRYPLILGHEFSGTIAKVGSGVEYYRPGMRVAIAPNMGCGVCRLCIGGNTHLCANYQALGIHIDGGFAGYVRIPAKAVLQGNVMELGADVSFSAGALAEPLSCVYNAFERAAIRAGDAVLIIGAGPIGIMHARLAQTAGAGKVMINDLNSQRAELCKKMVPAVTVVPSEELTETVMTLTGGLGVDVCITACPAATAQEMAIGLMAVNGRVIFFGGLPAGSKAMLDTNLIHYRQIIATGTARASLSQFRKTLDLISAGILKVDDLVTASMPICEFDKAFAKASSADGLKCLLTF